MSRHSEECAAGARTVRTVRGSSPAAACNGYEIRIANALPSAATFRLTVEGGAPVTLAIAAEPGSEGEALTLTAAADETRKVRVSVFGRPDLNGEVRFTLTAPDGESVAAVDRFLLPGS